MNPSLHARGHWRGASDVQCSLISRVRTIFCSLWACYAGRLQRSGESSRSSNQISFTMRIFIFALTLFQCLTGILQSAESPAAVPSALTDYALAADTALNQMTALFWNKEKRSFNAACPDDGGTTGYWTFAQVLGCGAGWM